MIDTPIVLTSTAYAPCSSGSIMADGRRTHFGAAANNMWPLGTRITIQPAFLGRHRFTIEDRIGWGTQLDLWTSSCTAAIRWGRRQVRVTLGWHGWGRAPSPNRDAVIRMLYVGATRARVKLTLMAPAGAEHAPIGELLHQAVAA